MTRGAICGIIEVFSRQGVPWLETLSDSDEGTRAAATWPGVLPVAIG